MAVFEQIRSRRRPDNVSEPVDSRNYIVPFTISSREEVPHDFARADLPKFRCGLFLPRRDPDKFGRSAYPPRILLLTDSTLIILTHPSDGTPPAEIRLSDIGSLETGNMLLRGWTEVNAGSARNRVEYNTRCFQPIGDFHRELRRAVFPPVTGVPFPAAHVGDAFDDVKFSRAGDSELDPDESVVLSFLSLPRRCVRRRWLIHGAIWQPGDLVICTDRRFIWITDRYKGLCERYGRVTRSVRRSEVRGVSVRRSDQSVTMGIRLRDGEWPIAVYQDLAAAVHEFADALTGVLNQPC
jgi:hypothetical protein